MSVCIDFVIADFKILRNNRRGNQQIQLSEGQSNSYEITVCSRYFTYLLFTGILGPVHMAAQDPGKVRYPYLASLTDETAGIDTSGCNAG